MKPEIVRLIKKPLTWWGSMILILACFIFLGGELINHRFWLTDFEVYYKAAQRLLSGENLYRHAEDGHYIFKYSPASAFLFIPFLLVPFSIAKYIYWLLLTAIIAYTLQFSITLAAPKLIDNRRLVNFVILAAGLTMAIHFMRELHLGQVNYLLLFIYTLAFSCYQRKKSLLFAILLACSLLIKPFALIFLPYLVLNKRYHELLYVVLFTLLLAILPLPFFGSAGLFADQYRMWFAEMQIELGNKQNLLASANDTIFSVIARYTPLRYIVTHAMIQLLYQFLLVALIILFLYHFIDLGRRNHGAERPEGAIEDFALLTSFIPLLSVTSENAFVFTQLMVVILMLRLPGMKIWEKVLAISGFFLIGGNFGELWGRDLSRLFSELSLITFGTLILVILLYLLRRQDSFRLPDSLVHT